MLKMLNYMEKLELEQLKPIEFFKWFCEICKIPHGSKNEKELINFLVDFAKMREIPCLVDEKGNVFMQLSATKGYENQPSILFQAHLDMVCVKEDGLDFDFEKDYIKLAITGDKLHAVGTSLGADNGVGVATMLAIADSQEIAHPPLEFLFTVEEEIGLAGVKEFDVDKITARRMINMDCGDSHVLAVCSMGKHAGEVKEKLQTQKISDDYCALKITINGGRGGHPSLSAKEGRACAANCLGQILNAVSSFSIKLFSINAFGVAIFKSAEAKIVVHQSEKSKIIDAIKKQFDEIKKVYEQTDSEVSIKIIDEVI